MTLKNLYLDMQLQGDIKSKKAQSTRIKRPGSNATNASIKARSVSAGKISKLIIKFIYKTKSFLFLSNRADENNCKTFSNNTVKQRN